MSKFVRPVKPNYDRGRIVINSDDGRIFDYTYHFPIIQRALFSGDQFKASRAGVFSPAVNVGYVDAGFHETVGLPMMSWDMLREIQANGGEILSHCKYHVYLSGSQISQPLTAGATRIDYTMSETRPREGWKFYITEGEKRDNYTVISYEHIRDGGDSHMIITPPLTNSYTLAARIYVHPDFLPELLKGHIDLSAEHGLTVKNHINPWYRNSAEALTFLKMYFNSVITTIQNQTVTNPSIVDVYDVRRTTDIRSWDFSQIDTLLQNVKNTDGVAFVQMHGNRNFKNFENLKYLVEKALENGIRVVKHQEGVDYILSKQ